jgi:predicted transposase YbfD/YdcC
LDIKGSIVVADALNCQKETAKQINYQGGDYLLSVKDNQKNLKKDIEDYVQDTILRSSMKTANAVEKNGGREKVRHAFVTNNINWLYDKHKWSNLTCIGAINTKFTTKTNTTNEWHYHISSRNLSAEELLKHARLEWRVESMHWLLDVHYREDFCKIRNKNV